MESSRLKINWTLVALFLVAVIIVGIIFIGLKCRGGQAVEITLAPEHQIVGNIYVGGAVNIPGIYPVFAGDTLDVLISAAGGLTAGAGFGDVELSVGAAIEEETPQKININRAEAWLMDALPGIGEVKAQAIVDYRSQHGFFHDVYELLNVPGISASILEKIKDYITVNG